MKKVILNKCYGAFDISYLGYKLYAKKKYNADEIFCYRWGKEGFTKVNLTENPKTFFCFYSLKDLGDFISHEDWRNNDKDSKIVLTSEFREDDTLIEVVEELGNDASGTYSELKVVEIPDDLDYVIDNYDGIEVLHQRVEEW